MRKKEIKCPYCGSKAKLVHFYDIYGKDATHPERYAWACARFPQCDSYVSTIKGSTKPAGTLADAQLRHERIEAHRVIKAQCQEGVQPPHPDRECRDRHMVSGRGCSGSNRYSGGMHRSNGQCSNPFCRHRRQNCVRLRCTGYTRKKSASF